MSTKGEDVQENVAIPLSEGDFREIEELIHDVWDAEGITGAALLESYKECVSKSLIDRLTAKERRILRNYLRDNGAPIRRGTDISIYRALTEALPDESYAEPEALSPPVTCLIHPFQITSFGPICIQASPPGATATRFYSQALGNSTARSNTPASMPSLTISGQTTPWWRSVGETGAATPNRSRYEELSTTTQQGNAQVENINQRGRRNVSPSEAVTAREQRNQGSNSRQNNTPAIPMQPAALPISPPAPPTNPLPLPIPAPVAPIPPLARPHVPQEPNNHGAARDLLELYSSPGSKYGGELEENLYLHERVYQMNCRALQVSEGKALETVYISLKGMALEFYFSEVSQKARSLDEAFNLLQKRFISEDRMLRSLMEWQTMTFGDYRDASGDDRKTLSRLYKRAMQLQPQLYPRYHSDKFLRDMLLRATAHEPFAATIHLHTPKTSWELIERMNLSIDARSRIQGSKKNPIDRMTGEIMRCRSCGSDSHLLRECRSASPAQLIYHLFSIPYDQRNQMSTQDLLDELQMISDDKWCVQATEDEYEERTEEEED